MTATALALYPSPLPPGPRRPSSDYAGLTDDEIRESCSELLGEWAAADKHPAHTRPWLLKGAEFLVDELAARQMWPDYVAAADDAIEDELERQAERGVR
jgi:hypothetical protein